MSSAASATNPHQRVQECVALIAGFHRQIYPVLVAARVDTIRHVGIDDLFKHVFGTCQPAFCTYNDKCGWFIDSLENVIGAKVRGCVLGHNLGILTTGLKLKG